MLRLKDVLGATVERAIGDQYGNNIRATYIDYTSSLHRSIGTESISYYGVNGNGDKSNTALFTISPASTTDAGLITTGFQQLGGVKVFNDNIVFNHNNSKILGVVFANRATTANDISAYASWRMVYHAEGVGTENNLDFETGEIVSQSNKNNWYSVLRLHPIETTTDFNVKKYGSVDIFGNTTITHGKGPRIYFTSPELKDASENIIPALKGWIGFNQSNNRLGIYDENAGFYLIRNYSTSTENNKYKSLGVSTEGSFYVIGAPDGTEEDRRVYVRMGATTNENGTNQISLCVNTDLVQGLYSSYGKWLFRFNPQNSLNRVESPLLSYFVGSKTSKGSFLLGAQRQWPDITNADGTKTVVEKYSEAYMGLTSACTSIFFEVKGFNPDSTAMGNSDEGSPNVIYYMNNANFITDRDGTIGLGSSSRRWEYLYSRYLYSRTDWDDYNATEHNTPGTFPLSIYLLSDDASLTSIEDTKSPGIGFATGSATGKLRGSLILNQEGFKFKNSQNNGYRAIHADSLILHSTTTGENSTGHIVFSRQADEGTLMPNYIRLPYDNGQIALMVNKTFDLGNAALVVDKTSIFPGGNNAFDVGTVSKRWRDGYFQGTLYLINGTDASATVKLDTTSHNAPALVIGAINGDHLELDTNEIMAKAADAEDATKNKASTLFLNMEGGLVQVGSGGLKAKQRIDISTNNTSNVPVISLYSDTIGTTSATGKAYLAIGNGSNSTTANNAQGYLRIYGSAKGYTDIITGTNNDSGYTLRLPGASGQFVYHPDDTQVGSGNVPVYISSGGKATAISNLSLGSRSSNSAATVRTSRKFPDDTNDSSNTSFVYGVTSSGAAGYLQVLRYPDATATTASDNALYIFSLDAIYPSTSNSWTLGTSTYLWKNVYATTFTGALKGKADTAGKLHAKVALKVGSTSKDFDGSAALTWTHAEIGATVSNTWTAGSTAGPKISTTVNGVTGTAVAIPAASSTASGVITTGAQTIAGGKTFIGGIDIKNSASWSTVSFFNTNMDKVGLQVCLYTPIADGAITSNRLYVRTYSYTSGTQTRASTYEDFRLPAVTADLTASKSYEILTNKELNKWQSAFMNSYTVGNHGYDLTETDVLSLPPGIYHHEAETSTDNNYPIAGTRALVEVIGQYRAGSGNVAADGYQTGYWSVCVTYPHTGEKYWNHRRWSTWKGWELVLTESTGVKNTGDTITGTLTINNTTSSGYLKLLENNEGGTIQICSKNGTYVYEIDAHNDTTLRVHTATKHPSDVSNRFLTWHGDTGELNSALFTGTRAHFTSTADASETSNADVALRLGSATGQHIDIDVNEILSKTDASTMGSLHLQGLEVQAGGTIKNGTWNGTAIGVAYGGTGRATLTSGYALIGNGTSAVALRAIKNNTSAGGLGWTGDLGTNLVTLNTIAYWNGTYDGSKSNLTKLGTISAGTWNGTTIGTAYGGTGNTSFTSGRLIYSSSATKLSSSTITISSNGSLTSVTTGTGGISYKVGNDNGTVGIYTATNMGLYDFTADTWLIYKNKTNNTLQTGLTLHLSRTTDAVPTSDARPALIIGDLAGTHLELDGNEIMAKTNGTTVGSLSLNLGGGAVNIGGNTTIGSTSGTALYTLNISRKGNSTTETTSGTLSFGVSPSTLSGYIRYAHTNSTTTSSSTNEYFYLNHSMFRPDSVETVSLGTSDHRWGTVFSKNINVSQKGAKSGQALANLGMVYSASEPSTKYEGLVWLCPA